LRYCADTDAERLLKLCETVKAIKGEIIVAKFERKSLYDQCAAKAIMGAYDCSIEEALSIIENGDYVFYPGIRRMDTLAHVLIQEGFFGDPEEMGAVRCYIDYDGLSALLRDAGYIVTTLGVVRVRRRP